jgi:O-antigen/teichoic acid export membrane protein
MSTAVQVESSICSKDVRLPSMRSNFIWMLGGHGTYAACQWGMLSIVAKLATTSVVGQFALALAISAPVFMFTNFQLRAVQATDAPSEFAVADYFTLRLLGSSAGLAFIIGIIGFLRYDSVTTAVIVLTAFAKAVESISDITAGLLQKHERLDRVGFGLMLRGLVSILTFGLLFATLKSLPWAVAGMACSWFFFVIIYDLRWAKRLIGTDERLFRLNGNNIRRLLSLSLPLGVVLALVQLSVNIPRYFIQHYRGSGDLGIFASLAYPVVAINLVIYALGQSATTRLSRMYVEGNRPAFISLIRKLVAIGVLIVVGGVPLALLCGQTILTVLYRPEYGAQVSLFAVLVGVTGVNAVTSFVMCGINAARRFRPQVPVNIFATVSVVLGCLLLVPQHGLMGAGMALAVSGVVGLLGSAVVLRDVVGGMDVGS